MSDIALPVRYDAMCRAIDAAYEVDEVKEIRDQAIAFEVYARQARNTEAERRACEIRLRAERRTGELDKQREKARGAAEPGTNRGATRLNGGTGSPPTLRDLGISKRQAHDWRKLADVPEEQFEAALADPTQMPTTAGIIRQHTEPNPERIAVSAQALWLWGRLKDFYREGFLERSAKDVLVTMTPEMLNDVHLLAPRVSAWLRQIGKVEQ